MVLRSHQAVIIPIVKIPQWPTLMKILKIGAGSISQMRKLPREGKRFAQGHANNWVAIVWDAGLWDPAHYPSWMQRRVFHNDKGPSLQLLALMITLTVNYALVIMLATWWSWKGCYQARPLGFESRFWHAAAAPALWPGKWTEFNLREPRLRSQGPRCNQGHRPLWFLKKKWNPCEHMYKAWIP